MMPDAKLAEAERPKRLFSFFHHSQPFRSDFNPIGNARGKAGRSRPVPDRQVDTPREFTDVGLGKAGVEQRRQNFMIAGRPLAEQ